MKLLKTAIISTLLLSNSVFAKECAEVNDVRSKLNNPAILTDIKNVEELLSFGLGNYPEECVLLSKMINSENQVEEAALALEIAILKHTIAVKESRCDDNEFSETESYYMERYTVKNLQRVFQSIKRMHSQKCK